MTTNHSARFNDPAFWKRTAHMILFALAYGVAETIVGLLVLVQFLAILSTGRASERLLRFGNSLSCYVRQILRFVLYNTETMPFPFADWPQEPADGERWLIGVPVGQAPRGQAPVGETPVGETPERDARVSSPPAAGPAPAGARPPPDGVVPNAAAEQDPSDRDR